MEKVEALLKIIDEKSVKSIDENCTKIYEDFLKDVENIINSFVNSFNEACKKAIELQNAEEKGEIAYIFICYMRTNILESNYEYRIDLYDEKWVLDEVECCGSLDVEFIFKYLHEHIAELEENLSEYKRLIKPYDIEKLKLFEANYYNMIGFKIIESFIQDIINCEAYREMKKGDKLKIFFGEFMDTCQIIYEEGEQ